MNDCFGPTNIHLSQDPHGKCPVSQRLIASPACVDAKEGGG